MAIEYGVRVACSCLGAGKKEPPEARTRNRFLTLINHAKDSRERAGNKQECCCAIIKQF